METFFIQNMVNLVNQHAIGRRIVEVHADVAYQNMYQHACTDAKYSLVTLGG